MNLGKINRQSIGISGFTSVLQHVAKPPSSLFIAGKLPTERKITVAIVGSRKPTAYGEEVTYRLAYDLAKAGVVVVSGLAYGVDAIAHKAALEAGGTTIAVLANGLHKVYPASHLGLARDIIKNGGAIISEEAMGEEARRYDFLARNRLVSGLADAVIVTESTERSGTLSTITHALDQNKELFAVPGPITSLLSAGPNRLLQQGAHVVLSAQDVLNVIAPHAVPLQTRLVLGDTPLETTIINLIQAGVCSGEALQKSTHIPAAEFSQTITLMELKGTIRNIGGNHWALA
ncbi:MAG: DNA-processing protein DprA [Candidatus Microsaccharimonas sp.]